MSAEIEDLIRKSAEDLRINIRDAANQMAQMDDPALFNIISNYMNKSDQTSRREWLICINALCQIDQNAANQRFEQALDTENSEHRYRIIVLLGTCGTPAIVPTLIRILKTDPWSEIRLAAAETLGAIGDSSAIPALAWSAAYDKGVDFEGRSVALAAENALQRIRKTSYE
jgi:HEAT repeat protein